MKEYIADRQSGKELYRYKYGTAIMWCMHAVHGCS